MLTRLQSTHTLRVETQGPLALPSFRGPRSGAGFRVSESLRVTYFAYLDEFGHIGPYLGRHHPRHNDSPVFGFAGLVLPVNDAHGPAPLGPTPSTSCGTSVRRTPSGQPPAVHAGNPAHLRSFAPPSCSPASAPWPAWREPCLRTRSRSSRTERAGRAPRPQPGSQDSGGRPGRPGRLSTSSRSRVAHFRVARIKSVPAGANVLVHASVDLSGLHQRPHRLDQTLTGD